MRFSGASGAFQDISGVQGVFGKVSRHFRSITLVDSKLYTHGIAWNSRRHNHLIGHSCKGGGTQHDHAESDGFCEYQGG